MLYNDDCLNVLPNIATNSIDAIISDPPYGLVNKPGGGLWQEGMKKSSGRDEPLNWDLIWTELFRIEG